MYVFKDKTPEELIAMGIAPISSAHWIERTDHMQEGNEAQSQSTSAPKLSKRQAKKVKEPVMCSTSFAIESILCSSSFDIDNVMKSLEVIIYALLHSSLAKLRQAMLLMLKARHESRMGGICFNFAKGVCKAGDTCKFSHNLDEFVGTKPPDLIGRCPFSNQAVCPYGEFAFQR